MTARRFVAGSRPIASIRASDGFDCIPEGSGYRLRVWGNLPPEWAGNFSLHAFVAGYLVVSGVAQRSHPERWDASLFLRSRTVEGALPVDFLNMARRAPRMVPELPEAAVRISLELDCNTSGEVHARVRGRDSIGLLAQVLRRFASLDLQPRGFALRTDGDSIDDSFWLEPASG